MKDKYQQGCEKPFTLVPDAVETVVITPGPSFRYLTGYAFAQMAHGSDKPCLFVVTSDVDRGVVLPELEAQRASDMLGVDVSIRTYEGTGAAPREAFEGLAMTLNLCWSRRRRRAVATSDRTPRIRRVRPVQRARQRHRFLGSSSVPERRIRSGRVADGRRDRL